MKSGSKTRACLSERSLGIAAAEGDIDRVAKDYEIPREAVEAAIAFYRLHRAVIDNRIAANSGEPRDLLQTAWRLGAAFYLDNCVGIPVVGELREFGHQATTTRDLRAMMLQR